MQKQRSSRFESLESREMLTVDPAWFEVVTDNLDRTVLVADIDEDGEVGFPDFLILSANFGGVGPDGDFDNNGTVEFADFLVLSGEFGKTDGTQQIEFEGVSSVVAEDEWLIELTDEALAQFSSPSDAKASLAEDNMEVLKGTGRVGQLLVRVDSSTADIAESVRRISSSNLVRAVSPNYLHSLDEVPNDPLFGQMWGLENINDADIDAPEAWDISRGDRSVVVAVLDTGVDYTHPDLEGNIWRNENEIPGNGIDDDNNGKIDDVFGYDFSGKGDGDPLDYRSHGTHVAGTIAAVGNNSIGVTGVAPNVLIMPLKIFPNAYSNVISEALNYVTLMSDRGVNIRATNNSYGLRRSEDRSGCKVNNRNETRRAAIEDHNDRNIVYVQSAGNDACDQPKYPSAHGLPNIITVANSNSMDEIAANSDRGDWVDLAAPGSGIMSTIPGDYGLKSGTSMAAPHVAGVAALVASVSPNMSAAEIKNAIVQSVDVIPSHSTATSSSGRLNARSALGAALPHVMRNGSVVIEAEDSFSQQDQGERGWVEISRAGASGSAVRVPDEQIVDPGLITRNYFVTVPATGLYNVRVRAIATTGGNNSVHVGVDGEIVESAAIIDLLPDGEWNWNGNREPTRGGGLAQLPLAAGLNTVSLIMREDGAIIDQIELSEAGVYEVRNDRVVIEAEDSISQTDQGDRAWDLVEFAGAIGGFAVQVPDEQIVDPGLIIRNYSVRVSNPGTYNVRVRAFATSSGNNTVHVGLDESVVPGASVIDLIIDDKWQWNENREPTLGGGLAQLELVSGVNLVSLIMREDGALIDQIELIKV